MGRRLNEMVSKEETQMASPRKKKKKKGMKRWSTSLIIKKMYIKPIVKKMQETTVRFHLTPVRMTIIKTINTGEDVEKREPSNIVGGNVNW